MIKLGLKTDGQMVSHSNSPKFVFSCTSTNQTEREPKQPKKKSNENGKPLFQFRKSLSQNLTGKSLCSKTNPHQNAKIFTSESSNDMSFLTLNHSHLGESQLTLTNCNQESEEKSDSWLNKAFGLDDFGFYLEDHAADGKPNQDEDLSSTDSHQTPSSIFRKTDRNDQNHPQNLINMIGITSLSSKLSSSLDLFEISYNLIDQDGRTTLYIRNIPNKYTKEMLLNSINEEFSGKFDFFHLPIDQLSGNNMGYAFINFSDLAWVKKFYMSFHHRTWPFFNSGKICEIRYARIQGRNQCESHFEPLDLSSKIKSSYKQLNSGDRRLIY